MHNALYNSMAHADTFIIFIGGGELKIIMQCVDALKIIFSSISSA